MRWSSLLPRLLLLLLRLLLMSLITCLLDSRRRNGVVNYEDENFNISLPVFAIHGNHDDPAGVRITGIARIQARLRVAS